MRLALEKNRDEYPTAKEKGGVLVKTKGGILLILLYIMMGDSCQA